MSSSVGPTFRLQLHGAIYRPDSFVLMLRYCANLKAIRYESTSLNGIIADKSRRVIVALVIKKKVIKAYSFIRIVIAILKSLSWLILPISFNKRIQNQKLDSLLFYTKF